MMRSYQVRIKTTKRQNVALSALLLQLCELYNMCLEQRRDHWKGGRSLSLYDQMRDLTELRAGCEEYAAIPAAIQRDPLRRLQRAFAGFYRRVKAGQKPGHPRFRSHDRYDSFSVDSQNFRIEGHTIVIVKLGGFSFRTRCDLRGIPKVLHIKRNGRKWKASISCDIGPAPEKVTVSKAVGIDVGLTILATLSNGSEIENPRWGKQAEDILARANRSFSSKKKGSRNRAKAREHLRRVHQSIAGRRRSYLHGVSRKIVNSYDLIVYEKLNIQELVEGRRAKSIKDAAWGELIWQITYKAESAGKWAVPVNPCGTTKICSGCGGQVPKKLRERIHLCPHCGLNLGRDHNAALNILALGESAAGLMPAEYSFKE